MYEPKFKKGDTVASNHKILKILDVTFGMDLGNNLHTVSFYQYKILHTTIESPFESNIVIEPAQHIDQFFKLSLKTKLRNL